MQGKVCIILFRSMYNWRAGRKGKRAEESRKDGRKGKEEGKKRKEIRKAEERGKEEENRKGGRKGKSGGKRIELRNMELQSA